MAKKPFLKAMAKAWETEMTGTVNEVARGKKRFTKGGYQKHELGFKNGKYVITGGWVDKEGLSPMTTNINGCTWGWIGHHDRHRGGLWATPGVWQPSGDQRDQKVRCRSIRDTLHELK